MSAKKKRVKTKNVPKTRKELRKEQRKSKKARRNEYYTNRRKPGQFVLARVASPEIPKSPPLQKLHKKETVESTPRKAESSAESIRAKEKREQLKLQKQMNKQRTKQLLDANEDEDRTIKRLEKQLKLNKRKSKSTPKSFAVDGLDYLLEVCDSENMKSSVLAEQQLAEVNDEFEEDFALMTKSEANMNTVSVSEDENVIDDFDLNDSSSEDDDSSEEAPKLKRQNSKTDSRNSKKLKLDTESESSNDSVDSSNDEIDNDYDDDDDHNEKLSETGDFTSQEGNRTWEDIYGRLRAVDGSVIKSNDQKYLPPAARIKAEETSDGQIKNQKLDRLKKQVKGLLNRLAESNMHNIAKQIEELYMNNSRHDMNNTITSLIMDAVVSNITAPERLLMEHVLLVAILHANIGIEVGAHFLQNMVKHFDESLATIKNVENKKLDNIVNVLAQLYNFKLFDSKLIYEILRKLTDNFEEKGVECILHILRNVGFNLRKDDPVALKNLILSLQKQAANVPEDVKNNSRVKFMLDVLLAIKNNNVSKIPNYDTSYSEHLKKIMKGFIRKGNYITQLNISLDDLLRADEKGKWWVIGSAWTGNETDPKTDHGLQEKPNNFSQQLLELAVKQRMNTDTRKNIFCIIMSAEDYLDAFEKLLHLALKNQQEREIIHVLLHCCLREKRYNPYYAALAQKFCDYDRKYQMTIKYSIWDKLKALKEHSATQISNLAKLLTTLFLEKALPISTLKIVQFSELDKVTLRFIRQILLGILLHDDVEACKGVFEKVCQSDKLKMFKQSLKLFIYHFLLRNLNSHGIPDDKKQLLESRVKVVEKLLSAKT